MPVPRVGTLKIYKPGAIGGNAYTLDEHDFVISSTITRDAGKDMPGAEQTAILTLIPHWSACPGGKSESK